MIEIKGPRPVLFRGAFLEMSAEPRANDTRWLLIQEPGKIETITFRVEARWGRARLVCGQCGQVMTGYAYRWGPELNGYPDIEELRTHARTHA